MNDELERIWKEATVIYSGHYSDICLEGQENNRISTSRKFTAILAKVRTKHLPNTNLGSSR
jgi:hypothetical protein